MSSKAPCAPAHREIIERDYHLSAGMYCDVAALDQFFWIFVNKDEHYHWIAIVEASADLLELGRLEYAKPCGISNRHRIPTCGQNRSQKKSWTTLTTLTSAASKRCA